MKQPTEYANISISTGASLLGENVRHFQRLLKQVSDTDALLQRLREERYAAKESVFEVSAKDALAELPGERLIPDRKLSIINSTTAAQWRFTYQAIIHDDDRENWLGQSDRERPSGRLDWTTALETYRESNRADTNVVEWAADSVTATRSEGQPALDFELANGDTMQVLTKEDVSGWLDDVTEVRMAWYPPTERQIIGGLTNVEPEEIEVTLGYDGPQIPREYTEPRGPDSNISETHAELLDNCDDPYANPASMESIEDVLTEGYFGMGDQLAYVLFLTGVRDTIRVSYGHSVPFLITRLARALNAHLTHIPQTGDVLLSRAPVPEVTHLEEEFPERQGLTDSEERTVRRLLGHPEPAIEFFLQHEMAWPRVTEQLAKLFDNGMINETEILASQFVDYLPAATADGIFEAIRTGQNNLEEIDQFDERYGTALGTQLRDSVERYGHVQQYNW